MKIHLICTAILCGMTVPSWADNAETDEKGVHGQVRLGYVNLDDNVGNKTDTLAVGGKLAYKTKNYRGLSAAATFYTTNPIGGLNEEGLFLDSHIDGYSILGEASVSAELGKTAIKLGRQELDTPFADTDDIGMIPNTFEGLVVANTSITNTTLVATHLHRWAGVDTPVPEKFNKMNGDKGVYAIGVVYEPSDQWNLQGWHYHAKNNTDISYLEAGFNPVKNLGLGLQYVTQSDGGFDGKVWGVSAEVGIADFTLSLAHNKVFDGQITNGFGGGPFFTSAEDHTIAEANNQKATAFGVEYSGIKNLTLAATQVDFNQGEDELDLSASYAFNEQLTADLIYSDMKGDGVVTRAFLNYDF